MKILVYGWYRQGNLGDDLFIEAFEYLFPTFEFIFTETISLDKLQGVGAVFFGGGSFLLDRPNITPEALECLKTRKVFYIGVGVEDNIHPTHLELMSRALLIITRSIEQISRLRTLNPRVCFTPDLVYALQPKIQLSQKINRSVLIMPNIVTVPQRVDPHWQHAAWTYFKSEFVQFLDWLIENDYYPHFFPMCRGIEVDDSWAIAELIGHMQKRNRDYFLSTLPTDIRSTTNLVSQYETIMTQRFHGIVLAEMTRTPYVAIHHHDKLKLCLPNEGKFLSYYSCSKHHLVDAFNQARMMNYQSLLPIETNIFEALVYEVTSLL